jgi:CPA2 family monovalent cation:H+ antiporter-2
VIPILSPLSFQHINKLTALGRQFAEQRMPDALLVKTLVFILASVLAVGLVARAKLPAAVGYLLAGFAIGPHGLKFVAVTDETTFLAELGIIFLMFMIGLEFSLSEIIIAGRDIFGAGSAQVGLTALIVTGITMQWGTPFPAALLLGGAVAMSSTAITLKQLAEQDEISSHHGRLALGVLLFQDLATLPFLVLLGAWEQGVGPEPLVVLRQLGIAATALVFAAFVCRPVFRAMLALVARLNSPDLLLLATLLLALGTAFVGEVAGLAVPIGAFLAGMVVGESDFRHQVVDDIRPFRDVLLGLFFATVGMEMDPSVVAVAPASVLGWMVVFVPVKALLAILAGTIMGWPMPGAARVAIIIAHGGEDGLLLLTQGMKVGAIKHDIADPALLALVASMALAPMLIQGNARLADFLGRASHRLAASAEETAIPERRQALRDHVLLCGCGRVGRLVALVLEAAKVPYVAVEADLTRFRRARRSGHNVILGDASRKHVLEAAEVTHARVLVMTFDRRYTVERLLRRAREQNPNISSIVSVSDDQELLWLSRAGAGTIFPENLAAGLALADQVLLVCGFSQDKAAHLVTTVRAELHPALKELVGM